jgi:hypothetical protein
LGRLVIAFDRSAVTFRRLIIDFGGESSLGVDWSSLSIDQLSLFID